ncbi:hypothetical protein FOZ63_032182 [Perkinsus olseni]|uniref:Uncharacterized protein n=1 Tax=Perkinsus olseni TaxID=32597 RepID=A0A7J6SUS8_PEROL|nr:hypothetical protein FOZ63_032182 [Perkinsus olseni]
MAYLQQQSDRDQEALNKLIRSTLAFDEMPKTVAGCGLSSSESDAATCASSSSGAELPAQQPAYRDLRSFLASFGRRCGAKRTALTAPRSGMALTPRDSVALEREAVKAETKCEVVKETTAELGGLETYLAQQREHLATAIFKDWVTPNASHERQARLKSACQELVRRSFQEVVCARATEPSKYTTRRMRRSADGPVE